MSAIALSWAPKDTAKRGHRTAGGSIHVRIPIAPAVDSLESGSWAGNASATDAQDAPPGRPARK